MMKKEKITLGGFLFSLLFISCGQDQQKKVCECSKLYDEISAKADEAEANGEDWEEAHKKAQSETGGKFEKCEELHKEVGDEKFYEMSKECK